MALDPKVKPKAEAKQKVESKPIVENKPEPETKKSKKLLLPIGLLIFAIIASGVTFLAFPYFKGHRKPSQEHVKATLALEPFLVNLADTGEARFVKATFQLGLAEESNEDARNVVAVAAMRDSIISLLTSKTSEQILTPQGKDKLREEIRSRVNAISPRIKVLEVYIVDFVVQL